MLQNVESSLLLIFFLNYWNTRLQNKLQTDTSINHIIDFWRSSSNGLEWSEQKVSSEHFKQDFACTIQDCGRTNATLGFTRSGTLLFRHRKHNPSFLEWEFASSLRFRHILFPTYLFITTNITALPIWNVYYYCCKCIRLCVHWVFQFRTVPLDSKNYPFTFSNVKEWKCWANKEI